MAAEESFEDLLRERVAGLAEGLPPTSEAASAGGVAAGAGDSPLFEARRLLDFAQQRTWPRPHDRARLAGIKRLIKRCVGVWHRPQSEFNETLVRVLERILDEQGARAEQLERARQELGRALRTERAAREEAAEQLTQAVARERGALQELARALPPGERGAHGEAEAVQALASGGREQHDPLMDAARRFGSAAAQPGSRLFPDAEYYEFENQFRGSEEEIRQRQRVYLPFLAGLAAVQQRVGPVLDVGCGRGELLELLGEAQIPALGVDSNQAMVSRCSAKGLDVRHGDLFADLEGRSDGSLAGLVAAQVVEHLAIEEILRLLRLARSKVAPGGGIVLETINPESLYAMKYFWHDPTHVRPIPAVTLEMLANTAGLTDTEVRFLSPVAMEDRLEPGESTNFQRLDRTVYGDQDYALLARVFL